MYVHAGQITGEKLPFWTCPHPEIRLLVHYAVCTVRYVVKAVELVATIEIILVIIIYTNVRT